MWGRKLIKTNWLSPNFSAQMALSKLSLSSLKTKPNQSPNLQVLKVRPKKKKIPSRRDAWSVVGYSTADQYNLLALHDRLLDQGYYQRLPLSEDLETHFVLKGEIGVVLSNELNHNCQQP